MSEKEFVEFCRHHGACNVDIDGDCEISFALELLSEYFRENPSGCVESLRDVYKQIEILKSVAI